MARLLTAALAILALGVGALLFGPGRMPRVVRPEQLVVEPASPIIGRDGTLAEALGIETMGGRFTAVLPRGAPVPATRMLTFGRASDGQSEIRLHLLRGVADQSAANHSLGWFRVGGLATGPSGPSRVTVFFRVTSDGISLAAVDPAGSKALPIEPTGPPAGP